MLAMGEHRCSEGLFGALHKVVSTTTMAMQFNTTRHYMHTQSINSSLGTRLNVAVLANLYNSRVVKEQRATVNPPRWSKNLTVVNLG